MTSLLRALPTRYFSFKVPALAGLILGFGLVVAPPAAAETGPLGIWATKDAASHVEIKPCAAAPAKLCGSIIALKEPLDEAGQPKHDKNNPDPRLQARPIIGLELMHGFVKDPGSPGKWQDGKIYNPEDGETYSCTMTVEDADHLTVRGYVGLPLFGKSQYWTRVK